MQKINGGDSHSQTSHVPTASKTETSTRRPSTNLQRLLAKDAEQTNGRSRSTPGNTTTSSPKESFAVVLKDKPAESLNEKTLTANKVEVVLSQQRSEKQESNSRIPLGKASTSRSGENTDDAAANVRVSPSSKAANNESKRLEEKQKLAKTLSPSLTALIAKDAKSSQSFEKNESKKVELNGQCSPAATDDSLARSEELSNSWEAFELKLQNKVKKSSEKPRGSPDTRWESRHAWRSRNAWESRHA